MSVFSDEDLKRLKEWLKNPKFTSSDGILADGPRDLGLALLARLEAAELCANRFRRYGVEDEAFFIAWRKSAGKDLNETKEK